MPLQKFQIYDIIVDIIPGIILTAFLIPLLVPVKWLSGLSISTVGVGIAIVVLSYGYVVGRLLHALSSVIHSGIMGAGDWLHRNLSRISRQYELIRSKVRPYIPPNQTFEQHIEDALTPLTPFTLKTALAYNFLESINEQYDIKIQQLDNADHLAEYKHLSYSILYNKPVLYRKYEILATFFRSMYVLCLSSSILYIISAKTSIDSLNWPPTLWSLASNSNPSLTIVIPVVIFLLCLIFFYEWRKFSHRRGWALIYDTYKEMQTNDQ